MYPLSTEEQKVCEDLFAHVAALNAINESEFALKFTLLEELMPFVEKLLEKTKVTSAEEKAFVARIVNHHLHICRNQPAYSHYNDLAIISYLT
jgi:hypothetical protein